MKVSVLRGKGTKENVQSWWEPLNSLSINLNGTKSWKKDIQKSEQKHRCPKWAEHYEVCMMSLWKNAEVVDGQKSVKNINNKDINTRIWVCIAESEHTSNASKC